MQQNLYQEPSEIVWEMSSSDLSYYLNLNLSKNDSCRFWAPVKSSWPLDQFKAYGQSVWNAADLLQQVPSTDVFDKIVSYRRKLNVIMNSNFHESTPINYFQTIGVLKAYTNCAHLPPGGFQKNVCPIYWISSQVISSITNQNNLVGISRMFF